MRRTKKEDKWIMGKKNKKIKSRCHNCGHRNKYGIENWHGRDKTKCKNCGELLNTVNLPGETNFNLCKEVKPEKMENMNNINYEMIRPVRNSQTAKKRGKGWLIFGTLLIVMLSVWGVDANRDRFFPEAPPLFSTHGEIIPQNVSINPPWLNTSECNQVKAVPSWSKNGLVHPGGYQAFKRGVDYLIDNNITFFYSSTCDYCNDWIIKDFGDGWKRYKDSGLTKKCW